MTATATISMNDGILSLDQLAEMNCRRLEALYQQGVMPKSMAALDGCPEGRMLAVRGIDVTPLAFPMRTVAGASLFPWGGKSFNASSAKKGTGINRLKLGMLKRDCFPFKTVEDVSAIDGNACIYLDYDLPENPWFIRKIRDELREVSPGLFLGPAMWKEDTGGAILVLWFAIDTRG